MQTYQVIGPRGAHFPPGFVLKLTGPQADARIWGLTPLGKGMFRVDRTVMFKLGEQVTVVEGEVSKAELAALDSPSARAVKAGKAKAAPADDAPLAGAEG